MPNYYSIFILTYFIITPRNIMKYLFQIKIVRIKGYVILCYIKFGHILNVIIKKRHVLTIRYMYMLYA